jgi:secreted trypsin-like serine protease
MGIPLFGSPVPLMRQPCVTTKGGFGQCMGINECYPERKIFQTEPKDTWIFGLYNTCSYNSARGKQVFGVCCTNGFPQMVNGQGNEVEQQTEADSESIQRKCTPMPTGSQCTYTGTRIVNGQEAARNSYPFMAALMRDFGRGGARQFCGGSLIDESHILTAAHCIDGLAASDVKTLRVWLGAHDIKHGSKTEHKVIRIIKHKDFDPRTLVNDIAILTLNTPAKISNSIKTVCLPLVDAAENERVTVAGWGSTSEGGGQPSKLHEVEVDVWSNQKCKNSYGNRIPGKIVDTMICAASSNKDSCSGDSGGPLYLRRNGGVCVQVGIVSWGIGCARPDSPGVYTRVTKMMDWIGRIQACY